MSDDSPASSDSTAAPDHGLQQAPQVIYVQAPEKPVSKAAVTGLIFAVLMLIFLPASGSGILFSPLAIGFGHVGLHTTKNGGYSGRLQATIAVCAGWIILGGFAVLLIALALTGRL
jgi:hypothetical protein